MSRLRGNGLHGLELGGVADHENAPLKRGGRRIEVDQILAVVALVTTGCAWNVPFAATDNSLDSLTAQCKCQV